MGRTYLFECSACGYRARVSGGTGRGQHVTVQTILCADCRELYDAVVEFKAPPARGQDPWKLPPFAVLMSRLPPRGAWRWVRVKPVCPVLSWHRTRPWKPPDKCPKCGVFVDQRVLFRLWD